MFAAAAAGVEDQMKIIISPLSLFSLCSNIFSLSNPGVGKTQVSVQIWSCSHP